MRVLILGADGYLGWPTAMHFSARGHDVYCLDDLSKRHIESDCKIQPLWPVPYLLDRAANWGVQVSPTFESCIMSVSNNRSLYDLFEKIKPHVVIHYAEQPSAPYSMIGRAECYKTIENNVLGTTNVIFAIQHAAPECHLIKLGTMGEYGTPNIDIEEGWIEIQRNGRMDRMLYPKKPGSFYHVSKCMDSQLIEFACRNWGLAATDLNQGIVYGTDTTETMTGDLYKTSFHYDAIFGTVLNRFCVQAANGLPLTVYGKGGQTRGFLNIQDTMQCVYLAATNPAAAGEFRVFNQFTEQFSVNELAQKVQRVGKDLGWPVKVNHLPNPRNEEENHYYNAKHTKLLDLGLKPNLLTDDVLARMMEECRGWRIYHDAIEPTVRWKQ